MSSDPDGADTPLDGVPDESVRKQHEYVVPLLTEDVAVVKVRTASAQISLSTTVHTREELIDELLAEEHAEIERVDIGRYVTEAQAVRQEDDVTIVPVVEEVLVVERRLLLKEEVRIRRKRTTRRHQEAVTLRSEEAVIVRRATGETALSSDAPDFPNNEVKEN